MHTKNRWIVIGALLLAFSSLSFNLHVKSLNPSKEGTFTINEGQAVFLISYNEVIPLSKLMDKEIAAGNLKLALTQAEDPGGYVHQRYDQYYQQVKVWGAQLIRHTRSGDLYCINGRHYDDIEVETTPAIGKEEASRIAAAHLMDDAFALAGEPELLILPLEQEYKLAYKVAHTKFDSLMISFVDALTGEVILKYNDVHFDATIGLGKGTLSDKKKLSTEYKNAKYWKIDIMRPAKLITGHMWYTEDVYTTYYITDDDNNWTDGAAVDAHNYLGLVYDYYYLVHGRKGMNNANMENVITVHLGVNYSNAFYHGYTKWMYFGDGDSASEYPICTALDVVAHEFTHGVTHHTSDLIYTFESGALNEAFSDIMGVSCEFFQQPEGWGYLKAEWWEGEDYHKVFQAGRDLSDPARLYVIAEWGWRFPDHYSKRYILPLNMDNGGVHINMTIASHWYYLLANGGTNKTSGLSVSGIGISKAEKIAYRAWVYYLHPSSNFASARSATYQAAVDLYGSGSTEATRVAQAWNAVGVY